jgi:hypothetical protein
MIAGDSDGARASIDRAVYPVIDMAGRLWRDCNACFAVGNPDGDSHPID